MPDKDNTPSVFYGVVLPELCGGSPLTAAAKASEDKQGAWATPQRAGFCYFKCVSAVLDYSLKRRGLDRVQLKQLTFALRLSFAEVMHAQLGAGHGRVAVGNMLCPFLPALSQPPDPLIAVKVIVAGLAVLSPEECVRVQQPAAGGWQRVRGPPCRELAKGTSEPPPLAGRRAEQHVVQVLLAAA